MIIVAFKITKTGENLSSILEKMDYGTGSLTNKGLDGDRLAELMIKYKVGVQIGQIYEICKIDTDFFEENNF
uniref:hypothetical protein n=1 Tax=Campylobacter concisus TaxID=199 RepID=UPI001D138CCA|nr:hypothetical protein [Campylobacter concisus]